MATFCLLPDKVNEFRKALKEKEITIPQLLNLTTEERVALLRQYAGDAAPQVNELFEEKLVLKNRLQGIKNWASKMGEIGKYSEAGKARLEKARAEYRAAQQQRIFSPKENETYLSALANKEAGTEITQEEAQNVFMLSKQADDLLQKFNRDTREWTSEKDRLNYGAAKTLYENYVSFLKGEGQPFTEVVKGRVNEFKATSQDNVARAVFDLGADALRAISDNAISLVASVDNSFLGRQGLKTLLTHPSAWGPAAKQSFVDIFNTLGGRATMDALMADAYSRPAWILGEYEKAGIVRVVEEQYPTSIPEQIPGIGRLFKASEVAFKGSGLRMRMDLFDLFRAQQKSLGLDMKDDSLIKDTGLVANSLTARGKFGKYGESPIVKLALWAPRMLKANYDVLTAHSLGAQLSTPWARKEAFKNLAKIIGMWAVILLIARRLKEDSVETDPTSSNWGKIIVADTKLSRILGVLADFVGISSNTRNNKTTFDITGGAGSFITFVSREVLNKSKSATTGKDVAYGSGYGQSNRFSAAVDFLTGKTTPALKVAIDFAKGRNFYGNKPTLASEAYSLTVPISIQNILGFVLPKEAQQKLGINQK